MEELEADLESAYQGIKKAKSDLQIERATKEKAEADLKMERGVKERAEGLRPTLGWNAWPKRRLRPSLRRSGKPKASR